MQYCHLILGNRFFGLKYMNNNQLKFNLRTPTYSITTIVTVLYLNEIIASF